MPLEFFEETVIVADNDSMVRSLLRTALEQPKRTILLCIDGLEAVELASQTLATLVLLDLRMPKLDGIEACRQIRALPKYESVPIAILTVFDADGMKRRALRAGASAFLGKPFSRAVLLAALDPLIAAHRRRVELERY